MRIRIFESLAQKLEQAIAEDPHFVIPAINRLAERYDVSYQTMWKAVQLLVKKGLVATRQGRSMRVSHGLAAAAMSRPTSTDRIAAAMRRSIADGTYRVGAHLPKIGYFARVLGVSRLTVSRALLRISGEGLAHTRRNRWIAGPAPAASAMPASIHEAPAILVVSYSVMSRNYSIADPFSQRFMAPFADECMLRRVRLCPALMLDSPEREADTPAGLQEIKAAIRRMGDRYMGTLLFTPFPEDGDLRSMIESIAAFRKPVVFFDSTDKGAFITCKGLADRKAYFRIHLDDRGAVTIALETLLAQGHTVIGMHGAELYDWSQRRAALVVECARRLNPSARIVNAGAAEPFWDLYGRASRFESIIGAIQRASHEPRSGRLPIVRQLAEAAPSLIRLLRDERPTALIAFNDELARDRCDWCKATGIRIPQDLSLVSFDNMPINLDVSTVDFGFSRLGYQAAHIFIGDIPIHADRNGNIPGICTLVDHGSIGKPAAFGRKPLIGDGMSAKIHGAQEK